MPKLSLCLIKLDLRQLTSANFAFLAYRGLKLGLRLGDYTRACSQFSLALDIQMRTPRCWFIQRESSRIFLFSLMNAALEHPSLLPSFPQRKDFQVRNFSFSGHSTSLSLQISSAQIDRYTLGIFTTLNSPFRSLLPSKMFLFISARKMASLPAQSRATKFIESFELAKVREFQV